MNVARPGLPDLRVAAVAGSYRATGSTSRASAWRLFQREPAVGAASTQSVRFAQRGLVQIRKEPSHQGGSSLLYRRRLDTLHGGKTNNACDRCWPNARVWLEVSKSPRFTTAIKGNDDAPGIQFTSLARSPPLVRALEAVSVTGVPPSAGTSICVDRASLARRRLTY